MAAKKGGRKPGTPNKFTKEARQLLNEFVASKFERLPALYNKLKPRYQAEFLLKAAAFCIPKLSTVTIQPDLTDIGLRQFAQMSEVDQERIISDLKQQLENQNKDQP